MEPTNNAAHLEVCCWIFLYQISQHTSVSIALASAAF